MSTNAKNFIDSIKSTIDEFYKKGQLNLFLAKVITQCEDLTQNKKLEQLKKEIVNAGYSQNEMWLTRKDDIKQFSEKITSMDAQIKELKSNYEKQISEYVTKLQEYFIY